MLELKNINVSFRSERQDRIFGHTRQQVLFDVSLTVKRAPVSVFWGKRLRQIYDGPCALRTAQTRQR